MHEVVAPRPLRLTSAPCFTQYPHSVSVRPSLLRPKPPVRLVSAPPTEAFARVTLDSSDEDPNVDKDRPSSAYEDADPLLSSRDTASPRFSPDALEEFLSILQPVVFNTPVSPIVRARYERPHPYNKPRSHKRTRSAASTSSDDACRTPERTRSREASKSSNSEERDEVADEIIFDPRPWPYSSILASPISRIHTQNPLARNVSHDLEVTSETAAYLIRAVPSPLSSPVVLALAQSIPIPPSPPTQVSPRVSSPLPMVV